MRCECQNSEKQGKRKQTNNARASSKCPEPGEGSQVSRRAPEEQHKGTPASKSALSGA